MVLVGFCFDLGNRSRQRKHSAPAECHDRVSDGTVIMTSEMTEDLSDRTRSRDSKR
jgi:hypothetical protein